MESRKKYYTLHEAVQIIENMSDDEFDEAATIDIVEIPPAKVDGISDAEEIDEDDLTAQTTITDTVGSLEVHIHDNQNYQETSASDKTQSKRRKLESLSIKWEANDMKVPQCNIDNINCHNFQTLQDMVDELGDKNPYEIFTTLTKDFYEKISEETNTYAKQNNNLKFTCTENDIKNFTGILILSGHRSYPRETCYWSTNENFDCPLVRNTMTKKKIQRNKKLFTF